MKQLNHQMRTLGKTLLALAPGEGKLLELCAKPGHPSPSK